MNDVCGPQTSRARARMLRHSGYHTLVCTLDINLDTTPHGLILKGTFRAEIFISLPDVAVITINRFACFSAALWLRICYGEKMKRCRFAEGYC